MERRLSVSNRTTSWSKRVFLLNYIQVDVVNEQTSKYVTRGSCTHGRVHQLIMGRAGELPHAPIIEKVLKMAVFGFLLGYGKR